MRLIGCLVVSVLLAASSLSCGGSSSADGPREGNFSLPVGVIGEMVPLNSQLVLLNTQTDGPGGSDFDVWAQNILTGQNYLLLADAQTLAVQFNRSLLWNGMTFLSSPANTLSHNCQIWMTDGTVQGTQLLIDLSNDPSVSFQLRDALVVDDTLVINISEYNSGTGDFMPRVVTVALS